MGNREQEYDNLEKILKKIDGCEHQEAFKFPFYYMYLEQCYFKNQQLPKTPLKRLKASVKPQVELAKDIIIDNNEEFKDIFDKAFEHFKNRYDDEENYKDFKPNALKLLIKNTIGSLDHTPEEKLTFLFAIFKGFRNNYFHGEKLPNIISSDKNYDTEFKLINKFLKCFFEALKKNYNPLN